MLYHDIHYVDVENEIEVITKRELKNCNFQQYFLNLNISLQEKVTYKITKLQS